MSDEVMTNGTISADLKLSENNAFCSIIFNYDASTATKDKVGDFYAAGLGYTFYLSIIKNSKDVEYISFIGDKSNINANKNYKLKVRVEGSNVILSVNGIEALRSTLPYVLKEGSIGIWCASVGDIEVSNLMIEKEEPNIFVVMQYTSPYNELYNEVIKKICKEYKINPIRTDERYGTGFIIADIVNDIKRSNFIIADISQDNPNVFYEVGYAHAIGKQVILIAEKERKLPFDISPFRTLFYENSISGKTKIEEGLRKNFQAILGISGD